jgi:protein-disulfide isomerase
MPLLTWPLLVMLGGQGPPTPPLRPPLTAVSTISIAGAPVRGAESAPLVLIEFADFQCPMCAMFVRETWPRLSREYLDTGRLRFVYRHLPVEEIHAHALGAAQAGVCAHRDGRFWELHARLFVSPERLSPADLIDHAAGVGLDRDRFARCLAEPSTAVRQDMAEAGRLGLRGTPQFVVGRVVGGDQVRVIGIVTGAQPFEVFDAALQAALAASESR